MKMNDIIQETTQRIDPSCWKGKHKEGTKIKNGIRVNNCVPNAAVKEAEGDPEGMPHLTRDLLKSIVQQAENEGIPSLVKSLEWGDGAADELFTLIVHSLKKEF